MHAAVLVLVLIFLLGSNLLWRPTFGPVYYERRNIDNWDELPIDENSILFFQIQNVPADLLFSVGVFYAPHTSEVAPPVASQAVVAMSPMIMSHKLKTHENATMLLISPNHELVHRVTSGQVNVLSPSYPLSHLNVFTVPRIPASFAKKTAILRFLDATLRPFSLPFQAWMWNAHASPEEHDALKFPDVFSEVWVPAQIRVCPDTFYRGIRSEIMFPDERPTYPGHTVFYTRALSPASSSHTVHLMTPMHPRLTVLVDSKPWPFHTEETSTWLDIMVHNVGEHIAVVYYDVVLDKTIFPFFYHAEP